MPNLRYDRFPLFRTDDDYEKFADAIIRDGIARGVIVEPKADTADVDVAHEAHARMAQRNVDAWKAPAPRREIDRDEPPAEDARAAMLRRNADAWKPRP